MCITDKQYQADILPGEDEASKRRDKWNRMTVEQKNNWYLGPGLKYGHKLDPAVVERVANEDWVIMEIANWFRANHKAEFFKILEEDTNIINLYVEGEE